MPEYHFSFNICEFRIMKPSSGKRPAIEEKRELNLKQKLQKTKDTVAEQEKEVEEQENLEMEEKESDAEKAADEDDDEDEQPKKTPQHKKTSAKNGAKKRKQPVFDASNDDLCVAVRAYFEDNYPVTAVTRAASIPAEDESEIPIGKMLFSLRMRYRSSSPSSLTLARVEALKDIEAFETFLSQGVTRKGTQANSSSTQRIAILKKKRDETQDKTLVAEIELLDDLSAIARQELLISRLQKANKA